MVLLDTLRERTVRKGAAAQVDCGELGVLTVEALPPAECARLARTPRALLYAACRELQKSGETLRKEGRLFRPDEVLSYVTDGEVSAACTAILRLSGAEVQKECTEPAAEGDSAAQTAEQVREEIAPSAAEEGGSGLSPHSGAKNSAPYVLKDASSGPDRSLTANLFGGTLPFERPRQDGGVETSLSVPAGQVAAKDKKTIRREAKKPLAGRVEAEDGASWKGLPEGNASETLVLTERGGTALRRTYGLRTEEEEYLRKVREELAEEAAYRLAEALRRAAAVR